MRLGQCCHELYYGAPYDVVQETELKFIPKTVPESAIFVTAMTWSEA